MTYFFSYDVTDTRRRNQISKTLEQLGLRVQKSVFQCDIPPSKAQELKSALQAIITEKEDSLLFYPVCDDCLEKARMIGDKTLLQRVSFEIL